MNIQISKKMIPQIEMIFNIKSKLQDSNTGIFLWMLRNF